MTDTKKQFRIAVHKCMDSFTFFSSKCLNIRNKAGEIVSLELNESQIYIHKKLEDQNLKTGKVRALIVKGRQQGASTYIEARYLWRVLFSIGKRAFILTHESEATKNLFKMAKLYFEKMPSIMQPTIGADSANELTFPNLNASYRVGTAGNKSVGRSETIQLLHGSESAFWPHADEHAKGVLQAVPDEPGTEVIMESTANGANGWFYNQVQAALRGEGEYQVIFVPWFWQNEYRKPVPNGFARTAKEHEIAVTHGLDNKQVMFMRAKIIELGASGGDGELAFQQEYPCTIDEAFMQADERSLIPANIVHRAMKSTLKDGYGKTAMGVDPARFGDDRTAIAIRKGRYIKRLSVHPNIDLMTLCGVVVRLIKQYKPICVNIDKGGLGAGVYDRLRELGYDQVNGINFGGKAYQSDRYLNRRAEIWSLLKLWLDDVPCCLPNRDDLLSDLTAPRYSYDSNGRIKLEKKEDMKNRGIRSPDLGDALALTFAEEFSAVEDDDYTGFTAADTRIGI